MAEPASSSSRIALIAAALLATAAIGIAIWRTQAEMAAPPPPAADAANISAPADPAAAVTRIEAALKANPNDAQGWRLLGAAHRELGNFGESVMAYRRATALEPGNAEGWASLGEALALSAPPPMSKEAKDALARAQSIDPRDPVAGYYLAVAKDMDGDHKGAIDGWFAMLQQAKGNEPWIPEVRNAIARVAAANNIDVAARLKAIRPAQSIATAGIPGPTPDQMRAAQGLPKGQQDAMVNQMVEGLAMKLEANPKNVDGWIMLMRSRVTLGQRAQANEALARAKAANPGDAAKLDGAARELGL